MWRVFAVEASGISSAFVTKCSSVLSGTTISMPVCPLPTWEGFTEPKPLPPEIATRIGASAQPLALVGTWNT